MSTTFGRILAPLLASLLWCGLAAAQTNPLGPPPLGPPESRPPEPAPAAAEPGKAPAAAPVRDGLSEVPRVGLVDSPFGLPARSGFVAMSGTGTSAKSTSQAEGGLRVGFAPLPRLTLQAFAGRDSKGEFAPSAGAIVRLLGSLEQGKALGLTGLYKAEGFSELGGEAELGLTGGLRSGRWTAMANAVVGFGLEEKEEGEVDGELKTLVGYDMGYGVRFGAEGQARKRFSGPNLLPTGRSWDVMGGPQLAWQGKPVLLAMSFGPSTVGVSQGVGMYAMLTVAAALY